MVYEGVVSINAGQEQVWSHLTDPSFVSQCAPGLKSLEIVEPGKLFKVVVAVGFGAVRLNFVTNLEWLDMIPPEHASLKAHASAPGSKVDVIANMRLSNMGDSRTQLNWTADIIVLGTVASLASKMMGGMIKQITGTFFECVKNKIEA